MNSANFDYIKKTSSGPVKSGEIVIMGGYLRGITFESDGTPPMFALTATRKVSVFTRHGDLVYYSKDGKQLWPSEELVVI